MAYECHKCRGFTANSEKHDCIYDRYEALQNRVKDLETECSGMGKLLESGVVIKTDEYLALFKVLEAASVINRDTTDCGRCMVIYDTLSELRMKK